MILSKEQAQSVIESPRKRTSLLGSRDYESRLRVFTQSMTLDELRLESGWDYFQRELRDTLTDKKLGRVNDFVNYPLSIVDISDNIQTESAKVFDSKNAFFNISAENEVRDAYLQDTIADIGLFPWIRSHGMDVLNNQANSCVVVDFDEVGSPYLVYVPLERLVDYGLRDKYGTLEYICYKHSVVGDYTFYSVYDDARYWVFKAKNNDVTNLELVSENENVSGRCPGRLFISESLSGGFDRRIPISTSLGKMSEWQRFDVFKSYADHYYPFPVIEKVRENCSIDGCVDGQINIGTREYEQDGTKFSKPLFEDCPVCSKKSEIMGPGLVIELQPRSMKDDPDYSGDFKMITPDVSSLKYIKDKLQELTDGIIYNAVGYNELLNSEAVNESQIQGSLESKTNVLLRLKVNFDILHKWILEQIVLGTYGEMNDVSINVNYGTEFYVYTESEIQAVYDNAKKSKLPISEVSEVYLQLIETKYKGNSDKIMRALMLYNIDPLPFDDWEYVKQKFDSGVLTEELFELKANFTNLVARFERENAPITKFGLALPFDKRIDAILKTIKLYLNGRREIEETGNDGSKPGSSET